MRNVMTFVHILKCQYNLTDDMSDGGFGRLKRCLDEFMECPAFHEFHDNVTNDGLFFGLLERIVKLNNVRLLSA
jgi:hypothetical protein